MKLVSNNQNQPATTVYPHPKGSFTYLNGTHRITIGNNYVHIQRTGHITVDGKPAHYLTEARVYADVDEAETYRAWPSNVNHLNNAIRVAKYSHDELTPAEREAFNNLATTNQTTTNQTTIDKE
jgi:hypothetical protein